MAFQKKFPDHHFQGGVREIHFKDNHAESLWFHPSTVFETPHPVARFCVEKISNKGNIVYVERACAMKAKPEMRERERRRDLKRVLTF